MSLPWIDYGVGMKWISVKDRLPLAEYPGGENYGIIGTYIVHFSIPDDPNEQSEVSYADYLTGTGWCYPGCGGRSHDFWADKITHWMKFPKAPAEFLKN